MAAWAAHARSEMSFVAIFRFVILPMFLFSGTFFPISTLPTPLEVLAWLTPIWHPNIEHLEPHHVCTNNVQNWFAAKPLAELVLAMGEMVQYKHYHAKWVSPFPLDRTAAEWVLQVAEPKGIVGPNKPFDDRPLLRAQRMRNQGKVKTDTSVPPFK